MSMPQQTCVPPEPAVPWNQRLLSLLFFAGLGPFYLRKKTAPPWLRGQAAQATGIFALLLIVLLAIAALVTLLSYTMIYGRQWYEHYHLEPRLMNVARKLVLCWLVFWAYGIALALFGSWRELPIVGALARARTLSRATAAAVAVFYLLLLIFVPLIIQANHLAAGNPQDGKVFYVYENGGSLPRWIFTLAFYRTARAAVAKYGPGTVQVIHISEDAIREAMKRGSFVFIGSHGMAQGLLLKSGWINPVDVQEMEKNPDLQFVYLTGCDSGSQKERWERAFAPARVVTYDRLTAVAEHAWWLQTQAPEVVSALR